MDCRRFQNELSRIGAGAPTVELRRHAESCRSCELELRARRLLSLGSHVTEGAPRAGFVDRLNARLRADGDRAPASWADAVGLVARPAFALAVTAMLLSVGLYSATPSTASRDDLALLAETDPVVSVLLSDSPAELLALPENR